MPEGDRPTTLCWGRCRHKTLVRDFSDLLHQRRRRFALSSNIWRSIRGNARRVNRNVAAGCVQSDVTHVIASGWNEGTPSCPTNEAINGLVKGVPLYIYSTKRNRSFWIDITTFLHRWPFVRGIHRSQVDSLHKGPIMWSLDDLCYKQQAGEQTVKLYVTLRRSCGIIAIHWPVAYHMRKWHQYICMAPIPHKQWYIYGHPIGRHIKHGVE